MPVARNQPTLFTVCTPNIVTHICSPSKTKDLGPCSVSKVRKPRLAGSALSLSLADDGAGALAPQATNSVVIKRRLANASRAIFLRLVISWIIPDKGGNWIPSVNLEFLTMSF